MSNIYDQLNPMQKEAVLHTEGPLLILAGAGSGKTRVLTHRIAYLIQEKGVKPWNILAITFTNKAAGEMRERVDRMVDEGAEFVWVATFHSTCVRILRRHADLLGYTRDFTIYDTDDQRTLIKRVLKTLDMDPKMYPERMLLSRISAAKNEMTDPDMMYKDAGSNYRDMRVADAYAEYQKQLMANDAMDFDDLLLNAVALFKQYPDVLADYQNRFKYIMVDEYQDTNAVQFQFVYLLAKEHRNLCVVGDDDQSIYKFRGADIRNILDFEKAFPGTKVVKLEQNYRSTSSILNVANEVIKHNKGRKAKTLWTDHGDGEKVDFRVYEDAYKEAEGVVTDIKDHRTQYAYGDCAVLYRTNAQSRLLEEKCIMYNVPYKLVGGVNFYQRREIKDVIAYLKTVSSGRDDIAVQRIINVPKRGIGATSITRIADYAADNEISFYEALQAADQIPGLNGGTRAKLRGFTDMIEILRKKAEFMSVKDLTEAVLEDTGYRKELEDEKTVEAQTRLENIEELINKAAEYPDEPEEGTALGLFLEEVALISDVDTLDDDENRVVLMTLHGAKGLEFPRVYMCGMEEGLFPSNMSIHSEHPDEEIEEERRLCYVGITRAKERLTLTCARVRMTNGETRVAPESRFVGEIPDDLLTRAKKEAPQRQSGSTFRFGGYGSESYASFGSGGYGVNPGQSSRFAKTDNSSYGARPKVNILGTSAAGVYAGREFKVEKSGSLEYGVGDRVSHVKFGEGRVIAIEEGKKDYEVTVDFDGAGMKKLFASFAKLKKL